MKPEINLLSPEARKKRMDLIVAHRIHNLLAAVASSLVIFLIIYGVAWQINIIIRNSLDSRLQEQGKERSDIEHSIGVVNGMLGAMNARITANPRWAIHVQDVLKVVPSGISIMKLGLQENPSILLISAKAVNGDVVVQYQKAIEALPWVDHVDAPLQNFARSPDAIATFTIFRKADNGGLL